MNVDGIKFDIYSGERVNPNISVHPYYVTPLKSMKITQWMIENNVDKIRTQEQMLFLLEQGWLGKYDK